MKRKCLGIFNAWLVAAAIPVFCFAQAPAVYDTDFSIAHTLTSRLDNPDGTLTLNVQFSIRNDTGLEAGNIRVEMSSPVLASPAQGSASLPVLAAGEAASASGSYTIGNPGIEDADLMMTVLWRTEYDTSSGVRRRCYIKAAP